MVCSGWQYVLLARREKNDKRRERFRSRRPEPSRLALAAPGKVARDHVRVRFLGWIHRPDSDRRFRQNRVAGGVVEDAFRVDRARLWTRRSASLRRRSPSHPVAFEMFTAAELRGYGVTTNRPSIVCHPCDGRRSPFRAIVRRFAESDGEAGGDQRRSKIVSRRMLHREARHRGLRTTRISHDD
jgi:hypothetical protein